jgi:type III secretion system YscQ/HrcQ family protein
MTRVAPVGPFPWTSLARVSAGAAADLRAARTLARRFGGVDAFATALGEVVGAGAGARLRAGRPERASGAGARHVAVRVEAANAGGAVVVACEPALARALVLHATKRAGGEVVDPARSAGPATAGFVAAVLVAAARRAGLALTVADAVEVAADLSASAPSWVGLDVTLDGKAFSAHVGWHAPPTLAREAALSVDGLRALGDLPLSLEVVVAFTTARAADLASLRRGDAWVPGAWTFDPRSRTGPVWLVASGGERAVAASLVEGGRVVLRGEPGQIPWSPTEDTMTQQPTAEALGDAPVVVRVEVGSAQMPAREWAELRAGDVVKLGRGVGEPVVLRAGGVEVARGELVQIDGELGVRIVELA